VLVKVKWRDMIDLLVRGWKLDFSLSLATRAKIKRIIYDEPKKKDLLRLS
jgi:hypothetical protein